MSAFLRHALPRDFDSIEAIENAADQLLIDQLAPERWDPAPPGSARAQEPGFLLVVDEAATDTILGFVHVLEVSGIAHLEQLAVLPEHGRRGHGGRLLRAALGEAWARGYESVTLRTYAEVSFNAPFYARAGFVETEPATEFHKHLVEVEEQLGLDRYGRRVQMTAVLPAVAH